MKDANVALVRQAIFTVLDEREWDFTDDEQRVDFADRVATFIPSATQVRNGPSVNADLIEALSVCLEGLQTLAENGIHIMPNHPRSPLDMARNALARARSESR